MAVVGASGSGKSSLVRAGLVPAYRRAREGPVVVMTPGSDPAAELKRSLSARPALAPDRGPAGGGVHALSGRGEPGPIHRRPDGPAGDELRVDRGRPPGGLLRTLRQPSSPRQRRWPSTSTCSVPMRADELRRAIEGPARAAGLRLEAGLVDTMLADVEGEPGALPLLSHALYESWARRDGRVLTRAGYRRGRRRARGDRPHGRRGLPGLQRARSRCSCGGCSSSSPSWARRRRTREGESRWRS